MIEFFNLFIVPVISLGICVRRSKMNMSFSFEMLFLYAKMAVSNAVAVFFVMQVIKALVGVYAYPNSQTYTLIAAFVALIIPLGAEIVAKNAEISVEIEKKN